MDNALQVAGFIWDRHRWFRYVGLRGIIVVIKNDDDYTFSISEYREWKAEGRSTTLLGGLEALQYQLECRGHKELARDVEGFAFAVKTLVPGAEGQLT